MADTQTTRVNAAMLPSFQGKEVCLLGKAKNVDSNGSSFTLITSDNQDIQIVMQKPLNEYVSGLVEVHGQVTGKNQIDCHNYVIFSEDVSESFNLQLYNTAVELAARAPQHYQQGIKAL